MLRNTNIITWLEKMGFFSLLNETINGNLKEGRINTNQQISWVFNLVLEDVKRSYFLSL